MTFLTPERPSRYVSMIGGLSIGWDVCGSCHRHVAICACDEGPSEPAFLAAERTDADPPFSAVAIEHRAAA